MTLIKKKEDKFYSPWPRIAAVSLVIALLGTILFTMLYLHLQIDWIESLAITFFTTSYHIIQEVINNMCHAELVHELIMLFSILSILFTIPFGALPVFLITAICATLFDSMFVMIQRYNRPRLVRIYERQNK